MNKKIFVFLSFLGLTMISTKVHAEDLLQLPRAEQLKAAVCSHYEYIKNGGNVYNFTKTMNHCKKFVGVNKNNEFIQLRNNEVKQQSLLNTVLYEVCRGNIEDIQAIHGLTSDERKFAIDSVKKVKTDHEFFIQDLRCESRLMSLQERVTAPVQQQVSNQRSEDESCGTTTNSGQILAPDLQVTLQSVQSETRPITQSLPAGQASPPVLQQVAVEVPEHSPASITPQQPGMPERTIAGAEQEVVPEIDCENLTPLECHAMKIGQRLGIPVSKPTLEGTGNIPYGQRIAYREHIINTLMMAALSSKVQFTEEQKKEFSSLDNKTLADKLQAKLGDKVIDPTYQARVGSIMQDHMLDQRMLLNRVAIQQNMNLRDLNKLEKEARKLATKLYNIYVLDWSRVPADQRAAKVKEYEAELDQVLVDSQKILDHHDSSHAGLR